MSFSVDVTKISIPFNSFIAQCMPTATSLSLSDVDDTPKSDTTMCPSPSLSVSSPNQSVHEILSPGIITDCSLNDDGDTPKSDANGGDVSLRLSETMEINTENVICGDLDDVIPTDQHSECSNQSHSETRPTMSSSSGSLKGSDDGKQSDIDYFELDVNEDDNDEHHMLSLCGVSKIKQISRTLQGNVFVAFHEKLGTNVIVKRTSKFLHQNQISIQNGKVYKVKEDILRECQILKHLSNSPNCPDQMAKFIDFIETDYNYYLVMEHGGSDLFEFVVSAHDLIKQNKMERKEWRKFVKYMFFQMIVMIHWLHSQQNCCHLDISLENMAVQNADFIQKENGMLTVNPQVTIKFIDFGLAEFFDPNKGFQCVKYVGKKLYKSPEIYQRCDIFDARQSDIWSLGVVLFCMSIGAMPCNEPCSKDDLYEIYIKKKRIRLMLSDWECIDYVTKKQLDLIQKMLTPNISMRYNAESILRHRWLTVYHKQWIDVFGKQSIGHQTQCMNHLNVYNLPTN